MPVNGFNIHGTCISDLYEETDGHYTLFILLNKTTRNVVKVHFYKVFTELRNLPLKNHRVIVNGALIGLENEDTLLYAKRIVLADKEDCENINDKEITIVGLKDLPF